MEALLAYGGLFAVAFLAATLLPAQSEVALIALLATDRYSVFLLLAVASAGNVLGSCLNYAIGRFLAESPRFKKSVALKHRDRAESWYRHYGRWSLLASWVPAIGDPLTAAAGVLREPFVTFLVLVTAAKSGRYLVLLALHQTWFG
jgi:membrane protein YqaA with SNARE-associated domain